MALLVLDCDDVRTLLTMRECMGAMTRALESVSKGEAVLPLRQVVQLPDSRNLLASMPGGVHDALGAKVITVFPGNAQTEYDAHQGAVLLFDPANGALLAVMDASEITAIRTAAVSGVATQQLARADADDLAILGAGVQAFTHLDAMREARWIRRVRVWSRTPARMSAFVERCLTRLDLAVEPMKSARDAVEGASIICTTTASREPVLHGDWIAPGAHINAVGASLATARELDTAAVARARLFVDQRESALAEAGDYLIPLAEGAVTSDHIAGELGEVLLGRVKGRTSPEEITLFKSVGLAAEDIAAARVLFQKASAGQAGMWIEFGGKRS